MSGLFAASAPTYSDLALVAELLLGVGLLVGIALVRTGRIRAHKYLQSFIVLVNIPIVLLWMVPEYRTYVLPGLPNSLGQTFYLVPTAMLGAGLAAESLGVYIILVAGTNLLPEALRFRQYKWWMRTEVGLWWSVLVLGLATYLVWYT